jgi:ATP-dependent DNA ligase
MFRYPDKPKITLPAQGLPAIGGGFFAQLKVDGWRDQIHWDGEQSTHTSRENRPLPVDPEVHAQFDAQLRQLGVKPDTLLDAEWCARRPACRTERIVLFDFLVDGGEPLWTVGALDRFRRLVELAEHVPETCDRLIVPYDMPFDPEQEAGRWMPFFTSWQTSDSFWGRAAEGIVLKGIHSLYIGRTDKCAENPGWIRCKWRAGEDGMTEVA